MTASQKTCRTDDVVSGTGDPKEAGVKPTAIRPLQTRRLDLTAVSTRNLLLAVAVVCAGLWAILLTTTGA